MNFLLSWCYMQSSMDLVTLEEFKAESYAARASLVFRHPRNFFLLAVQKSKNAEWASATRKHDVKTIMFCILYLYQ